ncbi:hypothetical protein BD309DRAFT_831827, partial [Dichomitus squalens]
ARYIPIYHCRCPSAQMLNCQILSGEMGVGRYEAALAISGKGRPVSSAVAMQHHWMMVLLMYKYP